MSPGCRDLVCVGVLDGPALKLLARETSNEVYDPGINNHYAGADYHHALEVSSELLFVSLNKVLMFLAMRWDENLRYSCT